MFLKKKKTTNHVLKSLGIIHVIAIVLEITQKNSVLLFQDTNKNRAYMSTKESLTSASDHVARSVPSQYCEFMKPIHATTDNTNLKLTKSSMYNTVCDFKIGKPLCTVN